MYVVEFSSHELGYAVDFSSYELRLECDTGSGSCITHVHMEWLGR